MNKVFQLNTLILFISFFTHACYSQSDLSVNVNPFIGTGGHGHTFPGPVLPFGMMQLSPDTRLDGWDGCGGYHYSDSIIHGFSHTHLSGTGVSDYGDLLVMPFTGVDKWHNSSDKDLKNSYSSRFNHTLESANPGYYSVQLLDYNIHAELTTTERCGMHKYTFPSDSTRKIIIDLEHRDKLIRSDLIFLNDSTIVGSRVSNAWAREQHFYFCLRVSEKPSSHRFFKNAEGKSTKLILEFDDSSPFLFIKIGMSAVDLNGAKNNLNTEMPNWNFSQYQREAKRKWNHELNKIAVESPSSDDKIIFYTALYHSFICPNLFSDADGRYRGMDMKIHKIENSNQYTIFSLWDTFRATHPLFTLVQREKTTDFIQTFIRQYRDGGILPIWELSGNYTGCMIGYHSIPVFTDALVKDINGFDKEIALQAMIHSANQNHLGLAAYKTKSYISSEDESESVSKTLEYAYDDWCIAVFAEKLGNDSIAKHFYKRSQSYKNLYNPNTQFMQPRYNGGWKNNFIPNEVTFDYTEANAWQYTLFAPHDIQGLTQLIGGKDALEIWLDDLFNTSSETVGREQVDITGLIGQYAHGNEPSHHMAYLYNYTNNPSKTQKYVHQIMKTLYFNSSDGLSGNEDCGQMSSWYVFSSLGFYPVTPGSPYYIVGTPNFESARITLENGNIFEISTKNWSNRNYYIEKLILNGKELNRNYLIHDEIMAGGKLEYIMTANEVNFNMNHPPYLQSLSDVLPAPYVLDSKLIFKKKKTIALKSAVDSVDLEYCIIHEDENVTSEMVFSTYKKPLRIKQSAMVTYRSKSSNGVSAEVSSHFYRSNEKWEIKLNSPYHNQYSGGGNDALIDNVKGGNDFRTGAWQGFFGQDMDVQINFKKQLKITKLAVRFLQDARSWIWFPSEVQFLISNNGKDWITLKVVQNKIPQDSYGNLIQEIGFESEFKAKHLRILGKYQGPCPKWHPGSGNASFIFADEIIISQ